MYDPDLDIDRDDYDAYVEEVPENAAVTAYLNDTAQAIHLRYGKKIYEIPQKYVQDGIMSGLGQTKKKELHHIKRCDDGVFRMVKGNEKNASIWTWRESIQGRLESLVDDMALVESNDPDFREDLHFQALNGGKKVLFWRNPEGRNLEHNRIFVFKEADLEDVNLQTNLEHMVRRAVDDQGRPKVAVLEKNGNLDNLVKNRLGRVKDTLLSNVGHGEAVERVIMQEKIFDTFDKQMSFDKEMPKGISSHVATLGVSLAAVIGNINIISKFPNAPLPQSSASGVIKNFLVGGSTLAYSMLRPLVFLSEYSDFYSRDALLESQKFRFEVARYISDATKGRLESQDLPALTPPVQSEPRVPPVHLLEQDAVPSTPSTPTRDLTPGGSGASTPTGDLTSNSSNELGVTGQSHGPGMPPLETVGQTSGPLQPLGRNLASSVPESDLNQATGESAMLRRLRRKPNFTQDQVQAMPSRPSPALDSLEQTQAGLPRPVPPLLSAPSAARLSRSSSLPDLSSPARPSGKHPQQARSRSLSPGTSSPRVR